MSSGHDPSVVGEQSYRQCLKMGVASLLLELGFDASSPTALETLTEILQSFLVELGRSSRSFTEVACRAEPLPADVLLALSEMGQSTAGIREYAFRVGRRTMPAPGVAQPVKTTSILSTGDRKKHRPGGIIPEHFLEFPDSHSYTRTPTHKQPVTDYESKKIVLLRLSKIAHLLGKSICF